MKKLIDKYLEGNATEKEIKLLEGFFESHIPIKKEWDENLGDKAEIGSRIFQAVQSELAEEKQVRSPWWDNRSVFKYAAVLLVASFSALFLLRLGTQPHVSETLPKEWVAKSTELGVKKTVRLPDGTIVKINGASTLRYVAGFDADIREVELEGEAFFDVAKDKSKPFVIRSGEISTQVLGTSFNVYAYDYSDELRVAVVEGKVQVTEMDERFTKGEKGQQVLLRENEMAAYNKASKTLAASSFDFKKEVGWKDGLIYFQKASQQEVIGALERWYAVSFEVIGTPLHHWDLTASFRNQTLEQVLLSISHTAGFDYNIKQKKVTLKYHEN